MVNKQGSNERTPDRFRSEEFHTKQARKRERLDRVVSHRSDKPSNGKRALWTESSAPVQTKQATERERRLDKVGQFTQDKQRKENDTWTKSPAAVQTKQRFGQGVCSGANKTNNGKRPLWTRCLLRGEQNKQRKETTLDKVSAPGRTKQTTERERFGQSRQPQFTQNKQRKESALDKVSAPGQTKQATERERFGQGVCSGANKTNRECRGSACLKLPPLVSRETQAKKKPPSTSNGEERRTRWMLVHPYQT